MATPPSGRRRRPGQTESSMATQGLCKQLLCVWRAGIVKHNSESSTAQGSRRNSPVAESRRLCCPRSFVICDRIWVSRSVYDWPAMPAAWHGSQRLIPWAPFVWFGLGLGDSRARCAQRVACTKMPSLVMWLGYCPSTKLTFAHPLYEYNCFQPWPFLFVPCCFRRFYFCFSNCSSLPPGRLPPHGGPPWLCVCAIVKLGMECIHSVWIPVGRSRTERTTTVCWCCVFMALPSSDSHNYGILHCLLPTFGHPVWIVCLWRFPVRTHIIMEICIVCCLPLATQSGFCGGCPSLWAVCAK